ncbi:MAG: T9SS type A sorting domain-containing protein [Bacteroidia bacterium]|nr:T9SS type A sorting domain-containing protein [Bacteroidia bacterium]
MKKIYLFLFAAFSYTLSAQLTQANHAPANGDTYTMYRCDSVNTSPGAAGSGVTWNFSTIATYSNLARSYTAQATSNSTFAAANVAVASGGNDIQYLASTTSSLVYYGGNIGVGQVAGTVNYSVPAIYASYPMGYNTSASAAVAGTLNIPSLSASGSFTGNSTVLVDGSGTIILPGPVTFTNALRVVSSQTIYATTSLATATVTQTNYDYYVGGIKAPVLTIGTATADIASILGNSQTTQTFVARNKDANQLPTGLNQHSENVGLSVYPNPSASFINFVSENQSMATLKVYDVTGKLVDSQVFHDGKIKLDVAGYNKGIYFYNAFDATDNKLRTGKFTVIQQ